MLALSDYPGPTGSVSYLESVSDICVYGYKPDDATPHTAYQTTVASVKQVVAAELTQRGYQQTDNNPDLLINIGAVMNEKTQTHSTTIYEAPDYTGQRRYRWQSQEVPVGTYDEGSVRIQDAGYPAGSRRLGRNGIQRPEPKKCSACAVQRSYHKGVRKISGGSKNVKRR